MFDQILEFEKSLAEFTGAPYAIMTDCCTHAIELCFRYGRFCYTEFPAYTYLSIPMTMHKLNISYNLIDNRWIGEYWFKHTNVWDSARRLQRDMYRPGQMQCLSFGHGKPLQVGRGGAILLDDRVAYEAIVKQRYDGRDLTVKPWEKQKVFHMGYHYKPTVEEAMHAKSILCDIIRITNPEPVYVEYPDLREIQIVV
jgi:hypothetical protein